MSVVVTKPMLPTSVLETFEGIFLDAWIGHKARSVSDGREFVKFEGDPDLRGQTSRKVLDLNGIELEHFLELGAEANTPLSNLIVEVLRTSDASDGIFPDWDKIDISALFEEVSNRSGSRIRVEDFLFSLVSRHHREISYLETRREGIGTLVTANGIETFPNIAKLEKRRAEFLASEGTVVPTQDDDDSYWAWMAVTDAITAVFSALGR